MHLNSIGIGCFKARHVIMRFTWRPVSPTKVTPTHTYILSGHNDRDLVQPWLRGCDASQTFFARTLLSAKLVMDGRRTCRFLPANLHGCLRFLRPIIVKHSSENPARVLGCRPVQRPLKIIVKRMQNYFCTYKNS